MGSSALAWRKSERAGRERHAKFLFTLHGLREASTSWENQYTKILEEAGFVTGLAATCTFFNKEKNVRVVVHGDVFIIVGGV